MIHRSIRHLAVIAFAVSAAAVVSAVAQDRGGAGGPPPSREPGQAPPGGARGPGDRGGPGGPGGRGPSVGGSMKGINRAAKQLSQQILDASKKDENLNLINDMERGCVGAKGLTLPPDVLAEAKDDAARAEMAKTYRGGLYKSLRMMVDIESDIIEGKNADAKTKLDALVALRDENHKLLGVKEEQEH